MYVAAISNKSDGTQRNWYITTNTTAGMIGESIQTFLP